MSTSLTGELSPLVQVLNGVRNRRSASSPASRTASARSSVTAADAGLRSMSRNGQPLETYGRRVGAVAEFEVVRRHQSAEHFDQVAGNGHLTHRVGKRAVLDP